MLRNIEPSHLASLDMKLREFSALCFDMDFTLVNYTLENFLPMVYNATARYLVEKKGYDKSLYLLTQSDKNLMRQGLILDKNTHAIIDVSSKGEVLSALMGENYLCSNKIEEIYPGRKWATFDSMQKTYESDTSKTIADLSYVFFDTPFITPAIPLISKHIEHLKSRENSFNESCKTFYCDLVDSLTYNYLPDNYKAGTGFYFPEMVKHTSDFIERASPALIEKLQQLRKNGTKILLMTASHIDYTELLMTYAYGEGWRDLFDVICCRIKKPGYFSLPAESRPCYTWNEKGQCVDKRVITQLNTTDIFLEGHWTLVDKWIRSQESSVDHKIAYVGDSFKSDILPTKLYTSWMIISIVHEGRKFLDHKNDEHRHISKKRYIAKTEGFGSFFGTILKPTLNAGKLIEHSDLTIANVEVLCNIDHDEELSCGDGNFYKFNPFES